MKTTRAAAILTLLCCSMIHGADVFYQKNLSLYVIHDVHQGRAEGQLLDGPVEKYAADAGAALYLKGQTLHLIRNTRDPKPETIETGVADFQMKDGVIGYLKNGYLHVRRVGDPARTESRRVADSQNATGMDVNGGTVVFLKNTVLHRVTDIDAGASERVVYPASNVRISISKP